MPKQSSPNARDVPRPRQQRPGQAVGAPRRRPARRAENAPSQVGRPSLIEDPVRTTAMIRAAQLGCPKGTSMARVGRISRETLDQWWKQSDLDKEAEKVTAYTRFTDAIEEAWGAWTEWALAKLDDHAEKESTTLFRKLARMDPDWTEVRRSEVTGRDGKPIETEGTTTVIEFTLPTNGFESPDALAAKTPHPAKRGTDGSRTTRAG
jgi:hypothetical protein